MTPFLLEFKLFFLKKICKQMSYKQLNLVVKEIEGYFFAKPESGKYSLLAYQLNPIKAAMQLQELLTKIQ